MKTYFKKLYRYNQWANTVICQHLKALTKAPEEVLKRLSHIVAAEEIWYNRITRLGFDPLPIFEIQPLDILEPRLNASALRWLELVDQTTDFEIPVNYKNLSGQAFENNLNDIMIHVANHGTYHRGQIATLLRQQGFEPLATDYIVFSREHRA